MKTTRRNLLIGATGLATGAILPAVAMAEAPPSHATDAAFVAAETEITLGLERWKALTAIDEDDPVADLLFERVTDLDNFIATAPAASAVQAAVKLRRRLDAKIGMNTSDSPYDLPALAQVLDFLEGMAGKPTHPTRAIASEPDD